jgi:AraC family transcriptional regulator
MLALPSLPINPPAARLGRVNAVLTGTSRRYHVPDFEGCLSLKSVIAGCAVWQAGGRRFAVHEHCFLVLNDRQHYTIDIQAGPPTTTFCLFFARGFVEDIWRATIQSDALLLDAPQVPSNDAPAGFFERLEPASSPVLAKVRRLHQTLRHPHLDTQTWDESFQAVAAELVNAQRAVVHAATKLPAARASTRMELCRRLLRGRDLLLSAWDQPLRLQEIAAGACLSPYHFHRAFTRLFGRTPHQLLTDYRLERVSALLEQSNRSILELCLEAGFQSPASFSTLFRRRYGMSPREYRRTKRAVCKFASFDKNAPRRNATLLSGN